MATGLSAELSAGTSVPVDLRDGHSTNLAGWALQEIE
jgi:hypothetical protein